MLCTYFTAGDVLCVCLECLGPADDVTESERFAVRLAVRITRLGGQVGRIERRVRQWASDLRHASNVRGRRVGSEY